MISILMQQLKKTGKKIFIITDSNVNKYYGDKVVNELEKSGYIIKKLARVKAPWALPLARNCEWRFDLMYSFYRGVAQLVAHLLREQGVVCSNHITPTKSF